MAERVSEQLQGWHGGDPWLCPRLAAMRRGRSTSLWSAPLGSGHHQPFGYIGHGHPLWARAMLLSSRMLRMRYFRIVEPPVLLGMQGSCQPLIA